MAFRRRTKSYPLFSQEFVIHNHADIGFCLVLCVLIGLMFEVSEIREGVPSFVRRPADPSRSLGSSSELGRGAAMYVICTPALYTVPALVSKSAQITAPPPRPQLRSLPAVPCSAAPLGTHLILQLSLQPRILSLASNQPQCCHPGPNSGVSFLVSGSQARRLPDPESLHNYLPFPSGAGHLFWAFPAGGTPPLFHLPSDFLGLLHLHVWPWPHPSSVLPPPPPPFRPCLRASFHVTHYHSGLLL